MENEKGLGDPQNTPTPAEATPASEGELKTGEIDYKAELENERQRRIKAESIIQRHKEKKPEVADDPDNVDDIDERIKRLEDKLEQTSKMTSEIRVNEAILKRAKTPEEATLIRDYYQNSLRPTGDPELDVENAFVLANKKRLLSQTDEIKAALDSKELRSSGVGSGQKASTETPVRLSPGDQKMINDLRKDGWILSSDAIRKVLDGESFMSLVDQGVIKKAQK